MCFPAIADLFAGNPDWKVFSVSAVLLVAIGVFINLSLHGEAPPRRFKEAVIFVNLAWFGFSIAGAVPFYLSGLDISFVDAVFETASGLTTTGSTVLTGLDTMPPGILLWRSLLQWIGGIGVVAIGIWLLPGLRIGGSQLFALESSESTAKPYGRVEPFVVRLLVLYAALTVSCTVLYILFGMTPFVALNHAFTTISTGGFSTSDNSFGQFPGTAIYWVAIAYMLAASVPFLFILRSIERKAPIPEPQIPLLLSIIAFATVSIFLAERWVVHDTPFHMFTLAAFNVVSVITTTGYAANDYLQYGAYIACTFFLLTFFGSCSGSTSGGFKMFRIIILFNHIKCTLRGMVRPHRIVEPKYNDAPVSLSVLEGVMVFAILYGGVFALFATLYAMLGLDLETALSASITALANVGPGVGDTIGPSGTFQSLPDTVKWLLAVQMILGRLEILAGIILVTPQFWER
ncbi:TrkH family potassium uptake protein [Roseibium sp. RKSG952]|nr:TrkH family potassium uptake protein [Roseibium sp. RKSG952]